jgi:hypothetical protein
VNLCEITHAERAGWLRRPAAGLARILDEHRDPPVIAWTVGPAGATLVGRVDVCAPAARARRVFPGSRSALALAEPSETATGDRAAFLRASATRNRVRLVLTATVVEDAGAPS